MLYRMFGLLAAVSLMFTQLGCDVDVQDEGKLPDVDVQTEPGRLPDVDVDGPEIDVEGEERTIEVPDVDIDTEEKTITVPDVDIDIPEEEDNELPETEPAP